MKRALGRLNGIIVRRVQTGVCVPKLQTLCLLCRSWQTDEWRCRRAGEFAEHFDVFRIHQGDEVFMMMLTQSHGSRRGCGSEEIEFQ